MDRSRLRELHFIAHLANVPSILRHGILSPCVVVADRNAASGITRFSSVAEGGIEALDARVVFARSWRANDDLKQRRCAEVLVPGKVDPGWIRRACVPDRSTERKLAQRLEHHELPIEVVPYLFFRSSDD
jgi:ssDNA thymidine ADP-ribosyltransferase, DarT